MVQLSPLISIPALRRVLEFALIISTIACGHRKSAVINLSAQAAAAVLLHHHGRGRAEVPWDPAHLPLGCCTRISCLFFSISFLHSGFCCPTGLSP